MLNSSQRKRINEYKQIRTVPPQKPPAVISSSKTSENPLPAFNFDSRPSINCKKKSDFVGPSISLECYKFKCICYNGICMFKIMYGFRIIHCF